MMNRRELFRSSSVIALIATAGLAGGCSLLQGGSGTSISQVVSDLQLIAQSLTAALPSFSKIVGIPPATLSKIQDWVAQIVAAAQGVASAASAAAAQPYVQQVESIINAILGALAGLPLPTSVETVLAAVGALLPVIEVAVGLVAPQGTPVASMAARHPMSAAQARMVLRSVR